MGISEDKKVAFQRIDKKVEKSREVILEAGKRFRADTIGVVFTGEKGCVVLLHLIKTACNGVIPFRVFTTDHSLQQDKTSALRERLKKEWGVDLITLNDEEVPDIHKEEKDRGDYGDPLESPAILEVMKNYGVQALMTAIRWDGGPSRSDERYFSDRGVITTIHPLLHFLGKDIETYLKNNNIPYDETKEQVPADPGSKPHTGQSADGTDRSRAAEDRETVMKRLKELGYF
jgi:3'-phosphoadenosine 5'-phosphosulfate sulfotransferase (PAPS reductase)/FAD synthetase